jgi:hypothetical protein
MLQKIKKTIEEAREPSPQSPEAIYQELNLLKIEGAIFAFSPKLSRKGDTQYTFMEYVKNPEEKIHERPIVITPNPEYGRPSLLAYKILNTIFKKLSDYGPNTPDTVPFTFRELAKSIGRTSWGGKDGADIYLALQQVQATMITCWGYDKTLKQWKNLSFNIFISILASGTKGRFSEGYVTIHPLIISNLKKNYHRSMNYTRMAHLDAISMALYKQVYNIFCTRRSHGQPTEFEKNYADICKEWLGGLSSQKHKSRILQQVGPHLDRLKETKLLQSYRLEQNAKGGWKLRFTSGEGFSDDYERFFQGARLSFPELSHQTEKHNIQTPLDLLFYFYTRLYKSSGVGIGNISVYSPKETDSARSILSIMPLQEAKDFVDFALAQAVTTSFDIKTFMGIRQYLPAWPSAKKEFEARKLKEERRKTTQQEEDLKSRFQAFRKHEIEKVRANLSSGELIGMEKHIETQLFKENPKVFGLSMLVRIKTDALLEKRFCIPSFEEWRNANKTKG